MSATNKLYTFLTDRINFVSQKATFLRTIYFPLCGIDSKSIKSSITPHLSGDIKLDKNHYLTKPVSTEDLRQDVRNFFVYIEGKGVVSAAQIADEQSAHVEIGPLWQKLVRKFPAFGLQMEVSNFVPVTGENVELMRVKVTNVSKKKITIIPTASIPVFGRSLANKHDHEHVTSLLHRTKQRKEGVLVEPTMSFNEQGHQTNHMVYYVFGITDKAEQPLGTFPTFKSFYGDSGTAVSPEAVTQNLTPKNLSKEALDGKEAIGALRFKKKELKPKESKEYLVTIGIESSPERVTETFKKFNSTGKFDQAFKMHQAYWLEKSKAIAFETGDKSFDSWMHWVTLQPVLRRIFGCSFLPDHDYGKGGKGWRDLWQDLLSLILIEPENIKGTLLNNFMGVRIDGSNATIIGSNPGEFVADRNDISRVWMDHGAWPFLTLLLYINQTGDYDILLKEISYFRDPHLSRTFEKDITWTPTYGHHLKDKKGNVYYGSVIEHLLIQNLVQFFNVGEHNITRLESADWNDGLDMAFERGESVAFMSFYGGNLLALADLLAGLSKRKDIQNIQLAQEVVILLDSLTKEGIDYDSVAKKKELLFDCYFSAVQPNVSGEKIEINIQEIIGDLRKKGQWIFDHIRKQEKVTVKEGKESHTWFNGYYDNKANRVEGKPDGKVWMTLTGQVFPVMSGLANQKETDSVVRAVKKYLQDKKLGGFRLNTDFGLRHYLDLGRAFGFAYGTKENGAFFSHMTVMYAYALYKQGFVKEGREVLQSIYQMSMDTDKSKIYPGIPEYFDSEGKGMYHYLTGSASWLVLTQLTQVFGVRGESGDLILSPKLTKEEFDKKGLATVHCQFAGKKLIVTYINKGRLDYGKYCIKEVLLEQKSIQCKFLGTSTIQIKRENIQETSSVVSIRVGLFPF